MLCAGSENKELANERESGVLVHTTHYCGHYAACVQGQEDNCTEQKECGANTLKSKTCVVQSVRPVTSCAC